MLEVYKKLRNLSAAINDDCTQNELLDEAKNIVLDICNEHVKAVHSFVRSPQIQTKVSKEIEDDCQELIDYVMAAKRFNLEVNARSKDRVVSFGEKLSCRFMTAMLKDRVRLVLAGNIICDEGCTANIWSSMSRRNMLISRISCITTARTG